MPSTVSTATIALACLAVCATLIPKCNGGTPSMALHVTHDISPASYDWHEHVVAASESIGPELRRITNQPDLTINRVLSGKTEIATARTHSIQVSVNERVYQLTYTDHLQQVPAQSVVTRVDNDSGSDHTRALAVPDVPRGNAGSIAQRRGLQVGVTGPAEIRVENDAVLRLPNPIDMGAEIERIRLREGLEVSLSGIPTLTMRGPFQFSAAPQCNQSTEADEPHTTTAIAIQMYSIPEYTVTTPVKVGSNVRAKVSHSNFAGTIDVSARSRDRVRALDAVMKENYRPGKRYAQAIGERVLGEGDVLNGLVDMLQSQNLIDLSCDNSSQDITVHKWDMVHTTAMNLHVEASNGVGEPSHHWSIRAISQGAADNFEIETATDLTREAQAAVTATVSPSVRGNTTDTELQTMIQTTQMQATRM